MATPIPAQDIASPLPELLSVQQLADYLGVPVSTIYAWRTRGTAPLGFRVGKQLRFRAEDVAAWLEQRARRRPEMREAGFPASEPLADENVDGNGTTVR
jgi:excisionase family DNA binding protein